MRLETNPTGNVGDSVGDELTRVHPTRGHARFAALPSVDAKRLGCSRQFVSRIRHGEKTPGPKLRAAVEREYGIPAGDFDAPPLAPPPPLAPSPPASFEAPPSFVPVATVATDDARAQLEEQATRLRRAVADRSLTQGQRLAVEGRLTRTLEALARIGRDDANPIVEEMLATMHEALKSFPEAADAVAGAFERIAKRRPTARRDDP